MKKTIFGQALAQAQGPSRHARGRKWVYVPYDQLNDRMGPMAGVNKDKLALLFIETRAKPALRDYHKQKIALVLTNMRHFALEQAQLGAYVRYVGSEVSFGATIARLQQSEDERNFGIEQLVCAEPAEAELRRDLAQHAPLVTFTPHDGFLTADQDFEVLGKPPWRMDKFYVHLRRSRNIMMDGGRPFGGRFSHDVDNRKSWPGTPKAPELPVFEADAITQEVLALVKTVFSQHMGTLNLASLPATQKDAETLWSWAQQHCLPHFGPYEDAMSQYSRTLFHTCVSALVNLHRLLPARLLTDTLAHKNLPLASMEGFVRQILGWREFVRHVHRKTNGLTDVPTQNYFAAKRALPPAWWGKKSGLACLDNAVDDVMQTGYSHHILRLMVLSNLATLMDVSPRELTDWFWCAYVDAYDWVVEPNVLGMGTFALGDLMMTKPYISGAAYIDRMSDYCKHCAFHPKKTCPITPMYWHFLSRHHDKLKDNRRMVFAVSSAAKRTKLQLEYDAQIFSWVSQTLSAGDTLDPNNQPKQVKR